MRIGIIGSGNIGGAAGRHWAEAGHEILFAAARIESAQEAAHAGGARARAGTLEEAAAFGPVVLVATPFKAWPEIAQRLGALLSGKIVIDATNPYAARDGAIVEQAKAAGEGSGAFVQNLAPEARLVKAFNTLPAPILAGKAHSSPPLALPLAGDDRDALEIVSGLIEDAGFAPVRKLGIAQAARFDAGTPVYARAMSGPDLEAALA